MICRNGPIDACSYAKIHNHSKSCNHVPAEKNQSRTDSGNLSDFVILSEFMRFSTPCRAMCHSPRPERLNRHIVKSITYG